MTSKKISQFVQETTFLQTDLINVVRSATNFTVPFSAMAEALGVTGTINVVGGAGIPVLEQPDSTTNNIRNIESGNGVTASISPQNGIKLSQDMTIDQTGAPLVVDKDIQSPVYRSIVAGSGIAVGVSGDTIVVSSSEVGATNTVIINQESDFPAPAAGVITLTDNTNYIIAANVSTSNRFILGENNAITANNIFSPVLTYTGTGAMFTGVDVNFSLSSASFNCPSATFFDLSAPTDAFIRVNIESITVLNCLKAGIADNLRVLDITNIGFFNSDDGITILGATQWLLFSITKLAIVSTSATYIGIDFGTSIQNTLEMTSLFLVAPAGGIGIKGLPNSGNITADHLATCLAGTINGGLTPLSGISKDDIRWSFLKNTGISNTLIDALMEFNLNTSETVIATVDTPVIVNAVWVLQDSSKFETTTSGRATYKAEQDSHLPVDISIGVIAAGGGANDITIYLSLNGTVITNTGRTIEVSGSSPRTLSIPWQLDLTKDDYLEVFIENNTGTTNLIVEHCILRVN